MIVRFILSRASRCLFFLAAFTLLTPFACAQEEISGDLSDPILVSEHTLPGLHFRLTQIELQDQTDLNNELVHEREWLLHRASRYFLLKGNLFVLQDQVSQKGWIFVRQSALPHSRPLPPKQDIEVLRSRESVKVRLFRQAHESAEDTWKVLTFEGGKLERTRALQQWQRSLRPDSQLHRTPRFLTNTWGDRSRDSRIQEDFLLKEIVAAAEMGADVLQIDDGWQLGKSANSAFDSKLEGRGLTGFWSAGSDFWSVNPERFPNGLTPILEAAEEYGIEIGLWYAPDSDDDFANWERDAATILQLHRAHGVRFFKIDGLKVNSLRAYRRAHQLLKAVHDGADEEVVIDLDVTGNDKRPGYLGAIPYGPIFVENRYTDRCCYWPHHTLRNLWKLATWIDPARLRMEFLNNTRRLDRYVGDELAPSTYPPDYLFATVMMSNPLGWFEASNLPEEYRQQVKPLAEIWREHRDAIFTSTILPVGNEPSGLSWTGFLAVAEDRSYAYMLCLREHTKTERFTFELPIDISKRNKISILHGNGKAIASEGELEVTIPEGPGHLLMKIEL